MVHFAQRASLGCFYSCAFCIRACFVMRMSPSFLILFKLIRIQLDCEYCEPFSYKHAAAQI